MKKAERRYRAMITHKDLEKLKKEYPVGTKVELISMDDCQAPPKGTIGEVKFIDDIGNIHVAWDNGSSLALIPETDKFRKVKTVTTVCYGEKKEWLSRSEAEDYFLEAMAGSDGSEKERYTNIYLKLKSGYDYCTDGMD